MTIPRVRLTVRDGGLGLVGLADKIICVLAIAVAGTGCTGLAGDLVSVSSLEDLVAGFTAGPLVDLGALMLAVSGGPIYCGRITGGVAGSVGVVSHVGTGGAVATLPGTVTDSFDIRVKITRAGASLAAATAAMQISLDGGDTYAAEVAVPIAGTYVLTNTGLTLTFADGTFVVNDTYSAVTVGPGWNSTNLNNALASVAALTSVEVEGVYVAGAASAALATVADTWAVAEAAESRFRYVVMEARDQNSGESIATWRASIIADFASFTSVYVGVCAGYGEVLSPATGLFQRRPIGWPYIARLALIPFAEHPGEVQRGGLAGLASIYHDAVSYSDLDTARFITARTVLRRGMFITRGNQMTAPGSDFRPIQNRRVLNEACRITLNALAPYLNTHVRVDADTGFILEGDAVAIEANLDAALKGELIDAAQATSATTHVTRTDNILSTSTLRVSVRVIPFGYAEFIEADVAFLNPALLPVEG